MRYGYGPGWGMIGGCTTHFSLHPQRSAGFDLLEERYVRGDINRDE